MTLGVGCHRASRAIVALGPALTYRYKGGDMAIGLTIMFAGGTQAQYRAVHSHMRVDENPLRGLIPHSEGPVNGDWGVIGFWGVARRSTGSWSQGSDPISLGAQRPDLHDPADVEEFPVNNITKP